MREIYVGSDCKCHVINDGTMTAVETEFFDGKCDTYVEGFLHIPVGEDGAMITPWKDYQELYSAQRAYERETLADMENALAILLGG